MGPTASGGLAPGRRELTSPAALAQSPKKKVTRIDLQTLKGIGKDDLVSRNGTPGIASTISGMFGGEKKSQE